MSTKELILEEALKQFSEKGFAGTSMRDIARPLGITKAALYKHFESKQQIFDRIVAESEKKFQGFFEKLSVHFPKPGEEAVNTEDVDVYGNISAEGLSERVLTFVRFSMRDPYSRQVRRMLTLSQFQSRDLAEMYTKRYVETMLEYDEKLFAKLMEAGAIGKGDAGALALMFYSPVVLYMGIWDREPDRAEECEAAIRNHVEQFFQLTDGTFCPFFFAFHPLPELSQRQFGIFGSQFDQADFFASLRAQNLDRGTAFGRKEFLQKRNFIRQSSDQQFFRNEGSTSVKLLNENTDQLSFGQKSRIFKKEMLPSD